MSKNQKAVVVAISATLIAIILIISLNSMGRTPKIKEIEISSKMEKEIEEVIKFTQEEEEAFVEQYAEKVLAFENSSILIEELERNIAKLSKGEAIQAVDGLMYVIFNDFSKIELSQDFMDATKVSLENGVNINDEEEISKIEDIEFSEAVITMRNRGYYFPTIDDKVSIQIDYKKINDKFGRYIGTDFSDLLNFSYDEVLKDYVNRETQKLNYNEVVNRILGTEILIDKHPESVYIQAFKSSNNFYNQLYLGALDMNYVYDKDMKILDETLEHYNKTIKENPDSKLAEKLKQYISKLESNDNLKTEDIKVYLLDLTEVNYENVEDSMIAPNEEATNIDEINESIRNVMKELSDKKANK